MKVVLAFLLLTVLANAASNRQYTYSLSYRFTNELGYLSPNEVYEGWIITPDGPVSTGRFTGQLEGTHLNMRVTLPSPITGNTDFVLTIEPRDDPDPAPSEQKFVSGRFDDDGRRAIVNTDEFWGENFCQNLGGSFFLATPTTAANTDDNCLGIWIFEPPSTPISLPVAPAGFTYEGWLVNTAGATPIPMSFGTFSDPALPDSDGAGPTAGPDMPPPFPGSDFIDPPINLCMDYSVVISVEPSPDRNPETPFFWKPLASAIDGSLIGPGNPQQFQPDRSMIPNFVVDACPVSRRQQCRHVCIQEYRECRVNGECNEPPTPDQVAMCLDEMRMCKRSCLHYGYNYYYKGY